jgi:hypothetical protein
VRQGAGLVLLARAAAESGQASLFDATASQCVQALHTAAEQDVLFNPFTVREVRLRGLLATGRTAQAADLAGHCPAGSEPPSPHWRVIERITTAEVLARAGDEHDTGLSRIQGAGPRGRGRGGRHGWRGPPGPRPGLPDPGRLGCGGVGKLSSARPADAQRSKPRTGTRPASTSLSSMESSTGSQTTAASQA